MHAPQKAAGFATSAAPAHQTDALLALLPELLTARALPPVWWVAHLPGRPSAVIGAAALEPWVRPSDGREGVGGFPAQVHVLPAWRRQGIGRALAARLVQQARAWDVETLQTFRSHGPDEAAAAFVRALGGRPGVSLHHFLGESVPTLAAYEKLEQALRARGRIPQGFRLVPLHEVPSERAAALHAWQFGGSVQAAQERLEQHLRDPLARALSMAVWDGTTLAALLVGGAREGISSVDYWVAEPTLRQGWPALMALLGHVRAAHDMGIRQGRYYCNGQARATLNIAERSGAQLEAIRHVYMLDLPACASQTGCDA